jgi:hypothetical protein
MENNAGVAILLLENKEMENKTWKHNHTIFLPQKW